MRMRTVAAGLVGTLTILLAACGTTPVNGMALANGSARTSTASQPDAEGPAGNAPAHTDNPTTSKTAPDATTTDPTTTNPTTSQTSSTSSGPPDTSTSQPIPRQDPVVGHTKPQPGLHVALTFDDGPDPTWTPQVLDLLAQYHVKATFCLVGVNAQAHPDLVRAIVAGGHALCNHTMHHNEGLRKLPPDARRAEIADARQAILAAAPGAQVSYFRAPAGNFSPAGDQDPDSVQRIAKSLGMESLAWSIDTRDWTKPGTQAIVAAVQKAGRNDVVLMHDAGGDRGQTVAALRIVLPWLVSRGYQFDFPA
ncbi:polysaccharide deacetylase family protein [Actinocrispum wychmicini]|uniref:Peptidoglycan/xylan/chitin deacetylase (PgdA/CDA1 family) n=1 Tax=Actinocrispum wychmicini TaxID=1213861 RepID=A0A4V6NNQ8_9PSEU|nr:polysaccharide deacetylase family protein [Actinocrispum wychmicini]TCO52320.1 peptidoglycan/xylan/chitin deacetylase (PgdA/CDA1 family) [Actinocrispum wychmicini]